MRREVIFFTGLALVTACNAEPSLPPTAPPPPPPPPVQPSVMAVNLVMDTGALFPGAEARLVVEAFDDRHNLLNSGRAIVTTSDSSVAALSSYELIGAKDSNGRDVSMLTRRLTMRREGTAAVRVVLDGFQDSVLVTVGPAPTGSALVVASFEVIEYRDGCTGSPSPCYVVYAPLLKLQEPTGASSAALVGVRVDVGHLSTGSCTLGSNALVLGPGASEHVNTISSDLWGNELIMVALTGVPVADSPARATLLVRGADGVTATVVALGKIVRNVTHRDFPHSHLQVYPSSCTS
jgi:hypothetical protein